MKRKFLVSGLIMLFLVQTVTFAHWADPQINILTENEVLDKVFESENLPNILKNYITREEFFALMAVAKNTSSDVKTKDFLDYSEISDKYVKYINALVRDGVVVGNLEDENIYIKPKESITRQEASVILCKMLDLTYDDYTLTFEDVNNISPWALPYIKGVVKAHIINGYPDNTVRPRDNITIAEAICMIGNLYTTDYIKTVEVFAGNLEQGSKNGELLKASFSSPLGLTKKDDTIFVVDKNSNMIRSIESGNVDTFAGKDIGRDEYNKAIGSFKDGLDALFDSPSYISKAGNGFFVTDSNNNMIRFINNEGYTTTYAGTKKSGYKDGKASEASFFNPTGIAVDLDGNVYVADTGNNVIRKIDLERNVTTYAGSLDAGYKDGKLTDAKFNSPLGLLYANNTLYVCDSGNQRIRAIKDGNVTTVAGSSLEINKDSGEYIGDFVDGNKSVAEFNFPMSLVADIDKNLYVSDYGNGAVRKIDSEGNVSTLKIDELKRPGGLLIADDGLYVSDMLLNAIYVVENY